MKITIHLPVTPAIKKYMICKFGKDYIINMDDWFGNMVINMLENKTNKFYNTSNRDVGLKTQIFDINFSVSTADKNGVRIIPQHEAAIFNIIDKIFREEMYSQALINKRNYFIDFQTTISNILDSYDISEDELSYEALKRDFHRKKEKLEQSLFL